MKKIIVILILCFLFASCHSVKPPETLPSPPPNWIIEMRPDGTYIVSGEFVVYTFRILGYANLYKVKWQECEKEKK